MITHDKWNKILVTFTLIIGIIVSIESFFGAYPELWIGYGILVILSLWFIFRKAQVQKPLASQEPTLQHPLHGQESNNAGSVSESEIRNQNVQLIEDVILDIKNKLKQFASIKEDELKQYQPRKNERLGVAVLLSIRFNDNDNDKLEIVFWLNDGLREFSTTGKKLIKHSIGKGCGGVCAKQAWLKRNLQDTFPNADFPVTVKKDYVIFHEETFSPQTSREELEKAFRTTAFDVLDQLLPRLVQLHNDGIL